MDNLQTLLSHSSGGGEIQSQGSSGFAVWFMNDLPYKDSNPIPEDTTLIQ